MLEHLLWLAHRPSVNEKVKYQILRHFGSAENAFDAAPEKYEKFSKLNPEGREALEDKNLEPFREAIHTCRREGIQILTILDAEYPSRLKSIYDPPLVLYYKGTLPDFDHLPAIAIIGTRKASAYGETVARRLGKEISACGGLVVSGLAAGIDGAAMNGALLAGCGPVGVLGCGVDVVYPRSNRSLFASTEKYGCILSEFMPGEQPLRWHFPKRNRIISGLCCGVVVVEAPEKSGALSTASHALDQGRDVFTVPGNIDIASFAGSNRLLRDGAAAISCGWDVLSEYQFRFPDRIHKIGELPAEPVAEEPKKVAQTVRIPVKKTKPHGASEKKDIDNRPSAPYIDRKSSFNGLSADEQAVASVLMQGERLVDDVIAESGLPSARVLSALTMLELKRRITRLPGKRVSWTQK